MRDSVARPAWPYLMAGLACFSLSLILWGKDYVSSMYGCGAAFLLFPVSCLFTAAAAGVDRLLGLRHPLTQIAGSVLLGATLTLSLLIAKDLLAHGRLPDPDSAYVMKAYFELLLVGAASLLTAQIAVLLANRRGR